MKRRLFFLPVWVLFVAFLLALACAPAGAQPVMPERVATIVNVLYTSNVALARGDDDQRRELTKTMIEQIVFEFPHDGWGWKRADPGRPLSKDSIAKREGTKIWAWDWQNGGTREPQVKAGDPPAHDISDQVFVEVSGKNHLGQAPLPQPPAPPVNTTPLEHRIEELETIFSSSVTELQTAITQLQVQVDALKEETAAQRAALAVFNAAIVGQGLRLEELFARPIPPVACTVRVFGVGISCSFRY